MTGRYPNGSDPAAGARNLLQGRLAVAADQEVLVVTEDAALGHYEGAVGPCIAAEARRLGARVVEIEAPQVAGPEDFPESLAAAVARADHTIFCSRIGDQMRFCPVPGKGSKTMTYCLDMDLLGADFCRVPDALLCQVHDRFLAELAQAERWRITCPLGTDAWGSLAPPADAAEARNADFLDFTVGLFPVMIYPPLSAASLTGRVVLTHWLTTTSTHAYDGGLLFLDAPIAALVEAGRIQGFEGPAPLVQKVKDHYARIGELFGVDQDLIGSWHSGINPKCFYARPARDNVNRWGSVAFGNPRYTHFHTCGDSPGEIAWHLFDATIALDDVPYWQDGRFAFLDRPDIAGLKDAYDGAETAFEMVWEIGI